VEKRALQFNSPHIALDEDRRGFADHMGTEIFKKAVSQFVSLSTRRADRDAVRRARSANTANDPAR